MVLKVNAALLFEVNVSQPVSTTCPTLHCCNNFATMTSVPIVARVLSGLKSHCRVTIYFNSGLFHCCNNM
jgi:hypothetical protein